MTSQRTLANEQRREAYDAVVLGRRSIRGYKQDPVPREVLREIIELAMRAP